MQILFTATIFLSAALLFCVQPMIAKAILPRLGGAPQVWIACMLFFQTALLVGYGYAHVAAARLGLRRQVILHIAVLGLPLVLVGQGSRLGIPITLPLDAWSGAPDRDPTASVLLLLAATVGLPFFAISTTSPLLQRWFSATSHPGARDPYFLYSASNLGSLLSLLGYPLALEPNLGLAAQSRLWAAGYGLVMLLTLACAAAAWRAMGATPAGSAMPGQDEATAAASTMDVQGEAARGAEAARGEEAPPAARRWLRWIVLSAIPSSHLLGVTAYVTTDIAPIPLLWVVPLAIYLITFIFVFAKRPPVPHTLAVRLLPLGAAASILTLLAEAGGPAALLLPLHLATFFLAAMVCHGELARDRPDRRHLTSFYLCLAAGGALGGIFNGLIAPLVFQGLTEYPLAIVLALLCRRVPALPDELAEGAKASRTPGSRLRRDLAVAAGAGALTAALILGWRTLGRAPDQLSVGVIFCGPLLLVYRYLHLPVRFGLSLGAIALATALYPGVHGQDLHRERNFFGVLRVTRDPQGHHRIVHGSTMHGMQRVAPERSQEPLGYYARTGPIGAVFQHFEPAAATTARIGVIGLGAGALASYARPGQAWTFYEINPAIERAAREPRYFTFLSGAFPGGEGLTLTLGDARLRLAEAPAGHFTLVIVDAFSSDAIPVHLITRQAISLYLDKLAPGGAIAFHISNNFLDLRPLLGNLAQDAGLAGLAIEDRAVSQEEVLAGKSPSVWAVLARRREDLGDLPEQPWAAPLPERPEVGLWTDDFSNVLRIMTWTPR